MIQETRSDILVLFFSLKASNPEILVISTWINRITRPSLSLSPLARHSLLFPFLYFYNPQGKEVCTLSRPNGVISTIYASFAQDWMTFLRVHCGWYILVLNPACSSLSSGKKIWIWVGKRIGHPLSEGEDFFGSRIVKGFFLWKY